MGMMTTRIVDVNGMVEIVVVRTTNTTPIIALNVHARILQQRLDVYVSESGLDARENSKILFTGIIFYTTFFVLLLKNEKFMLDEMTRQTNSRLALLNVNSNNLIFVQLCVFLNGEK